MSEPARGFMLQVSLSEAELAQLDNFMFNARLKSREDALRELIKYGLTASAPEGGKKTEH